MSHIVTEDGTWQWSAGSRRWKKVTPAWDSEEVHFINENWEGLDEVPLDPEQIELDEIELNSSDTAPLLEETSFSATPALAEAGGTLGIGTASAPGLGAVATGAGIAAGTVLAGTVAGVFNSSENEHQDPIVSIPDHRYIGPGNTVDSAEPVDLDDLIAREHDIAYERAETQQDIQEADREGANEFLTDALFNNNPHSALGYIGLKTKEQIEKRIGVQYPANLPSSISGMSTRDIVRLQRRKRELDPYKDPRNQPQHWPTKERYPSEAQRREKTRYIWDQWNRKRQNLGLDRVQPPKAVRNFIKNSTFRPPLARGQPESSRPSNAAISWQEFRQRRQRANAGSDRGPLIDALNNDIPQLSPNTVDNILNNVHHEIPTDREIDEINQIVEQYTNGGGIVSDSDFDDRDGAGPSGVNRTPRPPQQGPSQKRPRVIPPSDSEDSSGEDMSRPNTRSQGHHEAMQVDTPPTATTSAATGSGHNSASDGGFDSAQGPMSSIAKGGYRVKNGTLEFTKVHRMKCSAIPFKVLQDPTFRNGTQWITTPLVEVPWQFAYFYLSPEEFSTIPAGSYFKDCDIEIMQLVATTGYPTGGSTASIAQANHPKIVCYADDLDAKCRGGLVRKLTIDAGMNPIAVQQPDPQTFIDLQYGSLQSDNTLTVAGAAHDIPYYSKDHFCVYQPTKTSAQSQGFFTDNAGTIENQKSVGQEYFRNYITQLNSNDTTWDSIGKRYYKFQSAPIGEQFQALEIFNAGAFDQAVGSTEYYNAIRTTDPKNLANPEMTVTETIIPSSANTIPLVSYKQPIEQGALLVRGDASSKPARQPSFHIGMRAIDKFDPTASERSSLFVQASIEFVIKASIRVNLPAYPNRFIRPSIFTTGVENAIQGIGRYNELTGNDLSFITFGLGNVTPTPPALSAADAEKGKKDDNGVVSKGKTRTLPQANVTKVKRRK